ncbi:UNVERIFIED_CONTAM: Beta-amyrin 28-monooxygenase [Sesamum angustifolium]|uniref:Beta-amyrin 28-monooxygenase n=1 Tax=Sesamum angustifolium TaxID=2727405 RepID=A0AAW2L4G6_9LAMI
MLGENMEFAVLGPQKFVKDRMEKYSPEVFQTSLLGEKMAIFCGAQGNKFLFMNENKLLTSWWPQSMKKALLFPEFVESNLKEVSALKRSFHHDILKPEALKQYIPVMDALAHCFHVVDRHIKRLSEPFTLVTNGMFSVPIDLPGTAYNRAIKGGKWCVKRMRIITEGGADGEKGDRGRDLLSKMLLVTDEDGQFLSEMEISNKSLSKWRCKIKGPDELLTWEDIEKMKCSWNVARESLRLTPPAQGAFRETTTEFTYAGFTIPKGWKTFWTVHSSHKNPKYFPEPEKFDPSRFEGSGPAPYTFVPFGGGPRMCPGKEYARLEVLVFMHNVVRRFRLEKAIPNEKIVFHASPTPAYGLPVHLHPHEK